MAQALNSTSEGANFEGHGRSPGGGVYLPAGKELEGALARTNGEKWLLQKAFSSLLPECRATLWGSPSDTCPQRVLPGDPARFLLPIHSATQNPVKSRSFSLVLSQLASKKMDPQMTLQCRVSKGKDENGNDWRNDLRHPRWPTDPLDVIFDSSSDEEESQDVVNQILEEIGIEISGKMGALSVALSFPSASISKATVSKEETNGQLKSLGMD